MLEGAFRLVSETGLTRLTGLPLAPLALATLPPLVLATRTPLVLARVDLRE
jgi:hypothetical protein